MMLCGLSKAGLGEAVSCLLQPLGNTCSKEIQADPRDKEVAQSVITCGTSIKAQVQAENPRKNWVYTPVIPGEGNQRQGDPWSLVVSQSSQ